MKGPFTFPFTKLVRITRVTVCQIYHSAILKTIVTQHVVHYHIVTMGVDANCIRALESPVKHATCITLAGYHNSYAVDNTVRLVIEPSTAFNI